MCKSRTRNEERQTEGGRKSEKRERAKEGKKMLEKRKKRINNGMKRDRAKGNVYVRRIGL